MSVLAYQEHPRLQGWWALVLVVLAVGLGAPSPAIASAPPPQPNCIARAPAAFANPTDVAITDNATSTSTIAVGGLADAVLDVDVVTRIRHSAPADLTIRLTAPSGKSVVLSERNGGGSASAFDGTVWDDDADPDGLAPYSSDNGLVTDHDYVFASPAPALVPQEPLVRLVGESPNGTWTLTVVDALTGAVGVLDEWGLVITTGTRDRLRQPLTASTTVNLPVGDGGTASSEILLSGAGQVLAGLEVTTTITHPRSGDLQVTLTSPAGTTVTLTSNNGGFSADAFDGTRWTTSDTATAVTRAVFNFPSGALKTLAPEESFGAFLGEDPKGSWRLIVSDVTGNGASGVLVGWSLEPVFALPCRPDLAVTQTVSAARVRIGVPLVHRIIVHNVGSGIATGVSARLEREVSTRPGTVTTSAGGTCSGVPLECRWPGSTLPGEDRAIKLVVHPYVVGRTRLDVRVTNGLPEQGPGSNRVSATVVLLPSTRRAANRRRCTVLGTAKADTLRASRLRLSGPGVYCGLGGNDRIYAGRRNEVIDGGPGNDIVFAAGGRDLVYGGPGADRLVGGSGRDTLAGGRGNDLLVGGAGADILRGGPGRDRLLGGAGRDLLLGGGGVDRAIGARGDRVRGVERRR